MNYFRDGSCTLEGLMMEGKIGLEEHFAIEATVMDSHGFLKQGMSLGAMAFA